VVGTQQAVVNFPSHAVEISQGAARLLVDSGQIVVRASGAELLSVPLATTNAVTVQGTEPEDHLTIVADDQFAIPSGGYDLIGAGDGNRLAVESGITPIDFTNPLLKVSDFQTIDLTDPGGQSVIVDRVAVESMSPIAKQIQILGDPLDVVSVSDAKAWRLVEGLESDGRLFVIGQHVVTAEELHVSTGRPWQNYLVRSDVNNDGEVTVLDALRGINELIRRDFSDPVTQQLVDPTSLEAWPGIYFDQDGDGRANASDVLRVINELIRNAVTQNEAEYLPPTSREAESIDNTIRQLSSSPSTDENIAIVEDTDRVFVSTFSFDLKESRQIETEDHAQRDEKENDSVDQAIDELMQQESFLETIS